ncbi:LLM class flavin-dependent oxidoreductase [Streptomyces misionensis]|uniref:LLM class flavin-dependent oxidoreductase n=1 Tax=Streptomyces misionensis TaxID=67331 RepID=A0A5C6K4Y6_9ACTN|nr:LLM class flavin-dependent oxidoreductase [Streptomyces misionensis]TWV57411.1 LLM class flavin-dependent oxidoreductase [Streptomyces misionensis]
MTEHIPPGPFRFGVFLAPFHRCGQNPTLTLEQDLSLMEHLDALGFDEAWIGEHHSGGWETIGSPEVFIASAAARTRHLRFGTGVVSLPYHHPLMLAERMVLLDHLTRGRAMLGVGPGALPSDAHMMGIEVARQRDMMAESLEAVMALLRAEEPVTRKTDWFRLQDARLQLSPYTRPHFEVAVAAMASPSGPRVAGRFGCGLLSTAGTQAAGFDALAGHWSIVEKRASEYGARVDRSTWRIAGPMHLADSREQAVAEVAYGLPDWLEYFEKVATLPLAPGATHPAEMAEAINASGYGVIGTPDDAITQLERLSRQSGGFGCYLLMTHDWAPPGPTRRSYDLFARYVAPGVRGALAAPRASLEWVAENRPTFMGDAEAAMRAAMGGRDR